MYVGIEELLKRLKKNSILFNDICQALLFKHVVLIWHNFFRKTDFKQALFLRDESRKPKKTHPKYSEKQNLILRNSSEDVVES